MSCNVLSNAEDKQNILCEYCVPLKEASANLSRALQNVVSALNGVSEGTESC